ncbi:GTP-binding protein GEM-like [Petromyzon marinus]|uniref:GTP-binding protein GEM-like n=1 Tax=Petromyzon marinus TaxID=7757 RepID=UPI003F7109E1
MTLHKSDKLRSLERRRGSTPLPLAHQRRRQSAALQQRACPPDGLDPGRAAAAGARGPSGGGGGGGGVPARSSAASASAGEHRSSWSSESADSVLSGGSTEAAGAVYRVLLLGDAGVGKSSLACVLAGSEDAMGSDWEADLEDTYERTVSVDGNEATVVILDTWDQDESAWFREQSLQLGDAFLLVFSVTERSSLDRAAELGSLVRRARPHPRTAALILVGNKSDLARSREVSVEEGRAVALLLDCKFIETSVPLHHNAEELLHGAVRQVRLRRSGRGGSAGPAEAVPGGARDGDASGAAGARRPSLGERARRLLGRFGRLSSVRAKSKSCHDLSVP